MSRHDARLERAPLERRFDEAAWCLCVVPRLIAKYGDRTARELAEHFHQTTAGLDHEALVVAAARRATGPGAPPSVLAAIERQLWRELLPFSGWPECLHHVEPEGRS
jgi:hypothetical protein